jgi:hypothetical protein
VATTGTLRDSRPRPENTTASSISLARCRLLLHKHPGTRKHMAQIPRLREQIHPDLCGAIRDCTDGVSGWPLFVYGPAGVGKTCASLYLGDRVMGSVNHIDFSSMCQEMADVKCERLFWHGTHADSKVNAEMYWDRWAAWTLCVIDEVGVRDRITDHQYETLKTAIDKRCGSPLVIISNLNLGGLASLFDDRITSRISAGTVVRVNGTDRRQSRA